MEAEMEKAYQILLDVFGHSTFRLSQEAVIHRLLVKKENALVLFPTGGGKSLTYQVPALCLDGLTLVISPLLSLIKDQVNVLVNLGVKAANLDSTLDPARAIAIKEDVRSGRLKILFVAPERLNNEGFMALIRQVKISLLAVDESHCISQWGASFRPDYLKIARFAEEFDVERVLCLTATATPAVASDICASFFICPNEGVFRIPIYRPNLSLEVVVAKNLSDKLQHLVPFLQARKGPAIIYVTLQRHAEEVADHLKLQGLEAMVYHAGLSNEIRQKVQEEFMQSEKGIVCATIAFGMGIDKADIRQIVHLYMPKTLENYSQEIGRAGRDGFPSTCLMFLCAADIPVLEGFARGDTCSKKDLKLWLQELVANTPDDDNTLNFNLYQQSKTYDIRANMLGLLYAQLELDPQFKYLRAVTPFPSIYDISMRSEDTRSKVRADPSKEANVIRMSWYSKGSGYQFDVVHAAEVHKIPRADLAKKVYSWELAGLVHLKSSQIRARYTVLRELPKDQHVLDEIVNKMYDLMLKKEEEAIQKLRDVTAFATNDECLAHALSSYFGDADAVPDGLCCSCTPCKTFEGIKFDHVNVAPDPAQIQQILLACPERDDPRLLARMAFGITSPRLTAGKWSTSHPLFGSMGSVDFQALVAAFDNECKKAGYKKMEANTFVSGPSKRKYVAPSNRGLGGGARQGYKSARQQ